MGSSNVLLLSKMGSYLSVFTQTCLSIIVLSILCIIQFEVGNGRLSRPGFFNHQSRYKPLVQT